jgi:hypothetical protein
MRPSPFRAPHLLACGLAFAAAACGADAAPAATPAPAPAPAAAPRLDPTAAVVAEGRFIYRQRDLDALVLIANRHAKGKLGPAEQEQVRQSLVRALTAREPLLDALASLPSALASGPAHDALLLDLLDYQAEPAKPVVPAADKAAPAADKPVVDAKAADAKPEAKAADAPADGETIVSLPPLSLNRTCDGIGKRQLTLGIALLLPDAAAARRLEAKAPLIRDAIIGFLQQLPAAEFAEPDQAAMKKGLASAVIAKVPEFPAGGILIPQLEVTSGTETAADR